MKYIINERYEIEINKLVARLCGNNNMLSEEIKNELYLAILTSPHAKNNMRLCLHEAKCKAIDYMRTLNRQRPRNIKFVSLESMLESGFQLDLDGKVYAPGNFNLSDSNGFDDEDF